MATKNRWRSVVITTLSLFIWGLLFADQAIGQKPPSDVNRDFDRATQLHQSGDLEGAIRAYTAILKDHPARVDVRSNLGAAYAGLGRYEQAIEQYKLALSIESSNQPIRFNLSMAYYKAALYVEAASELTRFLTATAPSAQTLNAKMVLADCQVRLGNYKNVIDLLSPLAAADPNNRTVAYLLGSALIGDAQLTKGQEVIDRVFRDDNSPEAKLLMGSMLLLADDAQGALKEVERAIELNPKLPSVQAWYGRVLMRLGDTEKAKTAFRTELASNANDFDSNLYMGVLLRQDKNSAEAAAYLSHAILLRPRDQYARYHLAAVYAMAGKPTDAQPLLEAVVKEHGDFIEARVLLASVYYRLNRKDDGDRQKVIIEKLNADQQAKQPGSQETPKPAANPNNQN